MIITRITQITSPPLGSKMLRLKHSCLIHATAPQLTACIRSGRAPLTAWPRRRISGRSGRVRSARRRALPGQLGSGPRVPIFRPSFFRLVTFVSMHYLVFLIFLSIFIYDFACLYIFPGSAPGSGSAAFVSGLEDSAHHGSARSSGFGLIRLITGRLGARAQTRFIAVRGGAHSSGLG